MTSVCPSILPATSRASSGDFHDVHAALESVLESPFPAAAGVDLRLDHDLARADFARDLLGFFRRSAATFPRVRRGAEFLEQFFRLVFVDVHPGATRRRADVDLACGEHSSNGFFHRAEP